MTANPLKNAAPMNGHEAWTAMDYHRRAVENGDRDKAALWLAEAKRRGEIPNFSGDKD